MNALRKRRWIVVGAVLLGMALLVLGGLRVAVWQLQSRIEAALGPRASVGGFEAGWNGVDVLELRVKSAAGWPAEDELRARRVHIVPDLRSLFGGPWRIASVRVEGGYLSALRTRDGKLRVLPALLDDMRTSTFPSAQPGAGPRLEVASVSFDAARLDFFDASVRKPPLPLHLEQLDAEVGPVVLPALDQSMAIRLAGIVKGPQHDGRVAIDGHYTPATRDADVRLRIVGVDMVALQPYLLKVSEAGIRRGSLDLEMNATVVHNQLRAPGKLVLTNLELASEGPLGTFAGVPRKAVLAAMSEKGRLDVKFTLEGRLDDPSFSLNENLATRLASGLAEGLGVSLVGVVKGLGGAVKSLFGQ